MPKKTIVLFEDDQSQLEDLLPALKAVFRRDKVNVFPFEASAQAPKAAETYESRVKRELERANLGDIALFVTDRDLSKTYAGFSESVVSRVSDELAIPMCVYSQAEKDALRRASQWSDLKIILDITLGAQEMARQCRAIYEGFKEIEAQWRKIAARAGKGMTTPAEILATIIGEPGIKERIALYGAGDQHMLAEIFPFFDAGKSKKKRAEILHKRTKRSLGYWLWDSIIRFPGLLVNKVAAASYLGVAETDFVEKLDELFRAARYSGPFGDIEPMWWRHKLDEALASAGVKNGIELAVSRGKRIAPAKCWVDKKDGAGFYCMVHRKPVCGKHSRSNISWFPSGADLARISSTTFDELAPWLGLYS